MTRTSDKLRGRRATRARRRPRQRVKPFRVRRSTRRVLRDQVGANLEECFGFCFDHGFHRDPDTSIGSGGDPSRAFPRPPRKRKDGHFSIGNGFSVLESTYSSTTSQTITPLRSSFTFSLANPGSSSAPNSSTSFLLPSIPTTPPSHPIARLPNTTPKNGPAGSHPEAVLPSTQINVPRSLNETPFELPRIPSPFLYHNKSRELLQGIDEWDPNPAKFLAVACGQKEPDPEFKSCELDLERFSGGSRQTRTVCTCEPFLDNGSLFVGAALPGMSKAAPGRTINVLPPSVDFYKHTRSNFVHSGRASKSLRITNSITASDTDSIASRTTNFSPPKMTTTKLFPRWLWKMTHFFPEPYSHVPPLPPSTSSHELDETWDKQGLWEPVRSREILRQSSIYDPSFRKPTPAAGCKKQRSSRRNDTTGDYIRWPRLFWGSSCDNCPRETDCFARRMFSNPSIDAAASELGSAMSAFPETRTTNSADILHTTTSVGLWIQPNALQPTDSRRGSRVQVPILPRHTPLHHLRQNPIPTSEIQSVTNPSTLIVQSKDSDIDAGPTSACTTLVPSKLFEHQYLGWPTRRTAEAIVYQDKAWPILGAYVPHLEEELVVEGPKVEVGAKEITDAYAATEKVSEGVARHLDMHIDHGKDCQCADAWLEVLAGQSEFIGVGSDCGIHGISGEKTTSGGIKVPAKDEFARYAEDDLKLSFLDQIKPIPGSGGTWSEIDTENENEDDWDSDWDWSDDGRWA